MSNTSAIAIFGALNNRLQSHYISTAYSMESIVYSNRCNGRFCTQYTFWLYNLQYCYYPRCATFQQLRVRLLDGSHTQGALRHVHREAEAVFPETAQLSDKLYSEAVMPSSSWRTFLSALAFAGVLGDVLLILSGFAAFGIFQGDTFDLFHHFRALQQKLNFRHTRYVFRDLLPGYFLVAEVIWQW